MKRFLKLVACLLVLLILVVGIYVAYVFIAYERLDDNQELAVEGTGSAAKTGQTYTALSYNIGFGAYSVDFGFFMDGGEYSRGRSAEEVTRNVNGSVDIALDADADVIFFQEVDVEGQRSRDVNGAEAIRKAFDGSSIVFAQNYDTPYLFYPITQPIGSAVSGIMTVSDFEITSSLRRSLPIDTGFMKFFDLDRCYSVSRVPVEDGGELVLFNVHLSAYTADESIVRGQLEMLSADMAAEYAQGNYVVCGGDFNCELSELTRGIFGGEGDYSWSQPFDTSLLPEGFSLVQSLDTENPVPSSRIADGPYVEGETFVSVLDGFIVSDNVSVVDSGIVDAGFMYSDHNPVWLEFELNAP